jgi:hypothetical protein
MAGKVLKYSGLMVVGWLGFMECIQNESMGWNGKVDLFYKTAENDRDSSMTKQK